MLKNKTERQIPSLFLKIRINTPQKHFVTFLHKIFIIYLLYCDYFINLQHKKVNKLLFKRELIEKYSSLSFILSFYLSSLKKLNV